MIVNEEEKGATPKSFRVTEEIAEKIREITTQLGKGSTTQEAFSRLIEAYEMQMAKVELGDDANIVDDFELHMNILSRNFLKVMEDKQLLEKTIGTQYEALMGSKDRVIQELQEKIQSLVVEKDEAVNVAESIRNENREQKVRIGELEAKVQEQQKDYAAKLQDKDELNESFRANCADLRKKNEEMSATVEQAHEILSENKELQSRLLDMKKQEESLQKELKDAEAANVVAEEAHQKNLQQLKEKMELETEKRILKQKQQHAVAIEEVRKKAQAEIDSYQEKYLQLLERMGEEKVEKE